jgi:hypothetical protein
MTYSCYFSEVDSVTNFTFHLAVFVSPEIYSGFSTNVFDVLP